MYVVIFCSVNLPQMLGPRKLKMKSFLRGQIIRKSSSKYTVYLQYNSYCFHSLSLMRCFAVHPIIMQLW